MMNPGLDDELVVVVECMVATSSSEVPLAAVAAKHPKPAVSVPRQAEGPQAWAGGQPAWASPPEGPSSPSLLLVLVLVLLLLVLVLVLLLLLLLLLPLLQLVVLQRLLLLLLQLLLLLLLLLSPLSLSLPLSLPLAREASALPWVLAGARGQPAGEVPSPPESSSPLLLALACP
jgi:hypothetical protein